MRVVGTNHGGYANDRNIAGLPLQRHRVVRCTNLYRVPNFLYFKLRGKMHRFFPHAHWDGGLGNYDLLHFFNGVSSGRKPWMSTFETYLPRWVAYGGGRLEWGLRQLAKPSCKRLIALSDCTRGIQEQFLQDHPAFAAEVMGKVSVLHPPQAPLLGAEAVEEKLGRMAAGKESWELAFVGADFFRKGGLELLRAVDHWIGKGLPLRLTIVSAMHAGDYASHAGKDEHEAAMRIIAAHPQHIRHHSQLPYDAVLDLCRRADLGLLPTWADTYGYSVLEFMAAGCPVLATDIRALPEVVADDRGWLMPCRKDSWGNAVLHTAAERKAFSTQLLDQLIALLPAILQDPQGMAARGRAAYSHILRHHSPAAAAQQLESWYDAALKP